MVTVKIVEADKQLMLCWQKSGMTIDAYTREFKACIEVCIGICKAVGSRTRISESSTRLACKLTGNNYDAISILSDADNMTILKKMDVVGWMPYMAALHLEGLKCTRYGAL